MKKLLFTLVASTALIFQLSNNAQAQTVAVSPEIGLNISDVVGPDAPSLSESKMGYKAGVNLHIPIGEELYISPGIHYSVKGNTYKIESILGTFENTTNYGYLEIPVNLMYRVYTGYGAVFFSVGPYVGFGVAGKTETSLDNSFKKIEWSRDAGKTRPVDFGFNAGVGYELPFGLFVRAQYGRGFTSLSNDDKKVFNQNIQLSLGYNLWTWAR